MQMTHKFTVTLHQQMLNQSLTHWINASNALKEDLTEQRESQIRSLSLRLQAQKYCDFEKPTSAI